MWLVLSKGRWTSKLEVNMHVYATFRECKFAMLEYASYPVWSHLHYIISVHKMRLFSLSIMDGDHAIKARIFSFLHKWQDPFPIDQESVETVMELTGRTQDEAIERIVACGGDLLWAIQNS